MKTIFITIPWFRPAYKAGGPVQSIANLVAQFNQEETQYKIFASASDLDGSILQGVAFNQWTNYNAYTQVWYASSPKSAIPGLLRELARAKADLLFIVGMYSPVFTLVPLLFGKAGAKVVSVRGMLHPGALAQKPIKKKIFLTLWKLLVSHHVHSFHATDQQEKAFIHKNFSNDVQVFVAGNLPRVFALQAGIYKHPGSLKLISVALVSPMKNILLVLEALEQCPGHIAYDIYGPVKEASFWQLCLEKIKLLPQNITVTYHGDIHPLKVEEALQGSEVFILPSKSENFGHAFYEALSAGKPVITSHNTPWNNLEEAMAGKNVTTDAGAIANAINFFVTLDTNAYHSWSIAAANYAKKAVNIETIKLQYQQMFSQDSPMENAAVKADL